MVKIMYLTTDRDDLDTAMDYARKNGISLYPNVLPAAEEEYVLSCIEIAKNRDVDIIISRGRILALLEKLNCPVPFLSSSLYADESMGALWALHQRWAQTPEANRRIPKVALLTHVPLHIDEALYSAVFQMEVRNYTASSLSLKKTVELLLTLKSEGYDYVVCGQGMREAVEQVDIEAFYILRPSQVRFIWRALDAGKLFAQTIANYKRNYAQLQTVINYAFEAVVATDAAGAVTVCNQVAAKAFRCRAEEAVGKPLREVVPALPGEVVDQVLGENQSYYGYVLEYEGRTFVMNATAFVEKQSVSGAVFHFTEFQAIENLETARQSHDRQGYAARYTFRDIIGSSPEMAEAKRLAGQFAKYDSNVLIAGETGTGKELFAQSIHSAGVRKKAPFVAVNCGAIPTNLLESELFGYVDGAFTGASRKGKRGLVEIANHGTLFLDEISEMDPGGQVQLLRVLEERTIHRVGDDKELPVDIRVIAASNRNLPELVRRGRFREDLYYRLNVLTLWLPPLRDRGDDILLLTRHFVDVFGKKLQKSVTILPEAEQLIRLYEWRGNIRQLRNFCERLVIVSDRPALDADFLARQLSSVYMLRLAEGAPSPVPTRDERAAGPLPLSEKDAIIRALNESHGNRGRAAALLGISKTSLWRKMNRYQITEQF